METENKLEVVEEQPGEDPDSPSKEPRVKIYKEVVRKKMGEFVNGIDD